MESDETTNSCARRYILSYWHIVLCLCPHVGTATPLSTSEVFKTLRVPAENRNCALFFFVTESLGLNWFPLQVCQALPSLAQAPMWKTNVFGGNNVK